MAENINIAGRLHSTATGNVVAGANEIYDDTKGKKQSVVNQETDAALDDRYPKSQTYNKTELNNLITTPNQEYITVTATDQTTAATDVLPATGAADKVYRVGNWDGTQYDETCYSEYAWNGSAYVHLSTKTQIGEVFDISAYHATGGTLATYYNLNDALNGTNGGVPQSLQKGGMSVKYVQSSDNKYIQARCMAQNFTTDVTQWQWVGDELIAGSHNPVEGGVLFDILNAGDTYAGLLNDYNSDDIDTTHNIFYIATPGTYNQVSPQLVVNTDEICIVHRGKTNLWAFNKIKVDNFKRFSAFSDLNSIVTPGYYLKGLGTDVNPAIVFVSPDGNNISQYKITFDGLQSSNCIIQGRYTSDDGTTWSAWKQVLFEEYPTLNNEKGISSAYIYNFLIISYALTGNIRRYPAGLAAINQDTRVDTRKIYASTTQTTANGRFMHHVNGSWEYFEEGALTWDDVSSLYLPVDDTEITPRQAESSEKSFRDFSDISKTIYNLIVSGGDYRIPLMVFQGTAVDKLNNYYGGGSNSKCIKTSSFTTNRVPYTVKCPQGYAFIRNQYNSSGVVIGTSAERISTDFDVTTFADENAYEVILIRKPDTTDQTLSLDITPEEIVNSDFGCYIYHDNIPQVKLPKIDDEHTSSSKTWSSTKIAQEFANADSDILLNNLAKTGLKTAIDLNRNTGGSAYNFINVGYFTDSHANNNDASASISIMKQLALSNTLDYCIHGGDVITTASGDTYNELLNNILTNLNTFKNIKKLIFCKGNHDNGHVENADAVLTREQYKMLYQNEIENAVFNKSEDGCNYFYIDNTEKKFRLIVLDSYYSDTLNTINFGSTQENWLYNTALDFTGKSGWTVLVICHGFRYSGETGDENVLNILRAFSDKGTTYGTYTFDANIDAELVAVVHGHAHYDDYNNTNGFNDITVTKSYGTTPAVSIFTIDTVAKKIYETRIGDGNSRNYTY